MLQSHPRRGVTSRRIVAVTWRHVMPVTSRHAGDAVRLAPSWFFRCHRRGRRIVMSCLQAYILHLLRYSHKTASHRRVTTGYHSTLTRYSNETKYHSVPRILFNTSTYYRSSWLFLLGMILQRAVARYTELLIPILSCRRSNFKWTHLQNISTLKYYNFVFLWICVIKHVLCIVFAKFEGWFYVLLRRLVSDDGGNEDWWSARRLLICWVTVVRSGPARFDLHTSSVQSRGRLSSCHSQTLASPSHKQP